MRVSYHICRFSWGAQTLYNSPLLMDSGSFHSCGSTIHFLLVFQSTHLLYRLRVALFDLENKFSAPCIGYVLNFHFSIMLSHFLVQLLHSLSSIPTYSVHIDPFIIMLLFLSSISDTTIVLQPTISYHDSSINSLGGYSAWESCCSKNLIELNNEIL